jgi:phosphohistidine phosphatase
MKRIYFIRHAKADKARDFPNDVVRPLSARGENDAQLMSGVLAKHGVKPDAIISSSATRALQTAKIMAANLDYPEASIIVRHELYNVSADDILSFIQDLDDNWEEVLLVGHNPAMSDCANSLYGALRYDLPAGALCVFEFDADSWRCSLDAANACVFYDYPKKHRTVNIS